MWWKGVFVCHRRPTVQLVGWRSGWRTGSRLLGWGATWKPSVFLWPAAELCGPQTPVQLRCWPQRMVAWYPPVVLKIFLSFLDYSDRLFFSLFIALFPGRVIRACWPIWRRSLSDLWCWVMSTSPALKVPTDWGIFAAMETVSPASPSSSQ